MKDFDRVIASYRDAVPVQGLGRTVVLSEMRGQLSRITADNLVIHVNFHIARCVDRFTTAQQVATFLLAKNLGGGRNLRTPIMSRLTACSAFSEPSCG